MTGLTNVRVGHAGAFHHHHRSKRAAAASCKTGGFYIHPTNGGTVDCSQPVNITWDTTCLDSPAVDIYLYAPGANRSRLHIWETVNKAKGSYNATFQSKWWNSTFPMMLQLSIVSSGTPPFLSPFPAGPVFSATHSAPISGSSSSASESGITQVNNMGAVKKPLAPGRTFAAVLFPLLIVAALVAFYVRRTRIKSKEKSKRFTEAVDKRMSTISTDWKSMSGAGANAAIRNSIAVSGNRASSFSFGAIRPQSTFTDGGQAGVGARGLYSQENSSIESQAPPMSQLRPGLRTSALGERVSRVSFAADTRPSVESRRTVTSRAFHSAFTAPVPDLPTRQGSDDSLSPGSMSPTQTQGPLTLTPEDIRARISGQSHASNPGVDEVMPALSMMRTGSNGDDNEFLLSSPVSLPQPPTPSHMKSPVGMMPMQPMPANVMSPDEMLRAYAERRPGTGTSTVSYPAPVANYNGNGMRTLYSPTSPATPVPMIPAGPAQGQNSNMDAKYRMSRPNTVGSRYSEEYEVGTAE